ncbi:major facilitator superfamily-containing protein [Coleophoma crateriformis]|uniref:Major facilitator superfamily-containing protein n=1 Tax=Coleophoma crateriformis TaxID=565419 RepID=A0A3D8QET9_9HELO|nr:major facilitator superfamily-containing protein [Coleophoma crateriformis]
MSIEKKDPLVFTDDASGTPTAEQVVDETEIYIDPKVEAKILRKIDIYLMPLLTVAFLSAYLDRSNIGNAATAGLLTDIHMSSQQLANAVLLFFASYVPFELPGSLLVKKVRASRLLPLFMTFYTPKEQGRRFSYLYLSVGLSGAFGGLFAYLLLKLDGQAGLAGWRWLFIIEGILSVGISLLLWAFMPDDFNSAKFLNDADKKIMALRHEKHARYMALNESFDRREVWKCFRDPKIYLSGLIQFLGDILSLGTSTFLPIIIKAFGFKTVETQLLTVPIYTWGIGIYIGMSFWSDKIQRRAYFMIPGAISVIIAYSLLLSVPMNLRGVLYFSLFFLNPGIYCMLGLNYVWMLNSQAGYFKRATAIGINMTMGNAAGLIIGQIFKDHTPEGRYVTGEAVSLGAACGCIVLITIMYFYLKRQNTTRDALTPEERQRWIDEGKTGDAHPDFRFIL